MFPLNVNPELNLDDLVICGFIFLMVAATQLQLVDESRDVVASHRAFVRDLRKYKDLAVDLIRRTRYWVYDPATKTFSPSKFSGYVAMDFQRYSAAREGQSVGVKFDGGVTQRAIAQVLGAYLNSHELAGQLDEWACSTFGEDVLKDIDRDKWSFVQLPVAGRGLAALAGGWDGSDELVEQVEGLRRTPGRPAPAVE